MKKSKSSAGSFVMFPILLIGGIVLLWWNEGNYVKTASAIKEAQSEYVEVKDAKYDEKNNNKVIATNGKLEINESVVDEKFKISATTAVLSRHVEMYQWDENCDEDNNCSYSKKWSDSHISSNGFKANHDNPSMPFESEVFYAKNAKVGDYDLTTDNLEYLRANKDITLEQKDANNNAMRLYENTLYKGKDPSSPQIGDIKVSFKYLDEENVSLLGVQSDHNITKFVGKSGKTVMYSMAGVHTGDEMFKKLVDNNKMITWLLRLVGLVLLICAFASIFAPLRFITDRIPILGSIVGTVSGLFAFVVGFALAVIVIAVAWIAYRPVASIIAILAVIAIVVLFIKSKKNKNETSTSQTVEANQ